MKKTALVLALLTLPVFADTHVYECEMFVVEAKNGLIRNVVKANYGAMVVDRGEQFYVVRDDRVLSSPFLTKRNGEPRQPGGCKLKTAPVRPVVAARPAEYVCSEDLFY
ncbi:hypothetical protein Q5429_19605 [Escherichia coli]|nr:hypothetical protein [Escherichia coli]